MNVAVAARGAALTACCIFRGARRLVRGTPVVSAGVPVLPHAAPKAIRGTSTRRPLLAPRRGGTASTQAVAGGGGEPVGGEEEDDELDFGPGAPPPEYADVTLNDVSISHVKIKTAEYVQSCVSVSACPPAKYPEFAVIGRSNVGKSSLINFLTNKAGLAMVSKTPGKTKTINHFLVNKGPHAWWLVDLPGYGFAKTGDSTKLDWVKSTQDYFIERETLANVFLLVDCSIPSQTADLEVATWLADNQVPYSIIFTKMDKKKKKMPKNTENIENFKALLLEEYETIPHTITTSTLKKLGNDDVLRHIARLRELWRLDKEAEEKARTMV